MEINKFQKFLNNITKETNIDQDYSFLLGYDLNKDSIFSVAEMQALKNDIEKANQSDNDTTTLSKQDLESFYSAAIKKTQTNANPIATQEKLEELEEWMDLVISGNTAKYTEIKNDKFYKKLPEEKQKYVKELLKLENTDPKMEAYEFVNIGEIANSKNISRIKQLLTTNINGKFIPSYSMEQLLEYDIGKQNKAIQIIKDNNLDSKRILGTAKIADVYKYFPKDILKNNPDFQVVTNIDGAAGYKINEGENKTTLLYKPNDGLVEVRTEPFGNKDATIYNLEKNIIQNVRKNPTASEEFKVIEEKITKLDSLKFDIKNNSWIKGNVIETKVLSPGELDGVPNITKKDKYGTQILQQSKILDNGTVIVAKNFTSPEGITTKIDYTETPDGTTIMATKIATKTGEMLLDKTQTIKQISKNEFQTIIDNNKNNTHEKYTAIFQKDKLMISDENTTKTFDISKKFIPEGKEFIIKILEKTPANLLMAMDKIPINSISIDLDSSTVGLDNNARWSADEKIIELGYYENHKTDIKKKATEKVAKELLGTFLHEYGHYLDSDEQTGNCEEISSNEELHQIFKEEKEAFLKNSTGLQQEYINYFMDKTENERNYKEQAGEATMLLHTIPSGELAIRASYFQENLPRTIVKIDELINSRIKNN